MRNLLGTIPPSSLWIFNIDLIIFLFSRHLAQEEADRFEKASAKETKKLAKKLQAIDSVRSDSPEE